MHYSHLFTLPLYVQTFVTISIEKLTVLYNQGNLLRHCVCEKDQKISMKLSHIEGNDINKKCTDAVKSTIMTSFKTVHLDSDFSVAFTKLTTICITEETNDTLPNSVMTSSLCGMSDLS
jgi:hypothetical protein